MVNGRFTCDKVVWTREKICRYILKRDPFRGNYGLIRAFVNQQKEELGLEESTIFVFRFRCT